MTLLNGLAMKMLQCLMWFDSYSEQEWKYTIDEYQKHSR